MSQFSYPSLRALYIEVKRDELVSKATGFVVLTSKGPHLITNKHVVTGTNVNTRIVDWIPTHLAIHHHKKGALGQWVVREEELTIDNENVWVEHRALGAGADFVAVPLKNLKDVDFYDVDLKNPFYSECESDRSRDFMLGPSDTVSIVGFPFGKSSSGYFPIWVTGFLASELTADFEGLPVQLVDSRTRQGQSGSPVFAYRSGGSIPISVGASCIFSGPVAKFIGVYSGRINADSDLGRVWKTSALIELITIIENGL